MLQFEGAGKLRAEIITSNPDQAEANADFLILLSALRAAFGTPYDRRVLYVCQQIKTP